MRRFLAHHAQKLGSDMQFAHHAQDTSAPCAETEFESAICASCAGFWRIMRSLQTCSQSTLTFVDF
ncbi:hypothetical protein L195_g010873 [Trifolium pratense]|uniref:Uncharacterized protein n=1 Tax=Trifolium pratense TaxID=57577 RepID=A0A2K3PFY0_TRIPR|nr:hypothetical protein L195_g010873 [Trifolium pratense]